MSKIRSRRQARHQRAHSTRATSKSALIEPLEKRRLLAVSLVGVADWLPLGAAPQLNSSTTSDPGNPASGGVEDLAVDPSNPARMFAGTINGGIWMTTNGNRPFDGVDNDGVNGVDDPGEQPTWVPLTDQYRATSIGDIRFDPSDATNNTLFAGTGSASSLSTRGTAPIGVMKTIDGGLNWSVRAVNPGNEPNIRAVLPTTIDFSPDAGFQQVVFVGTSRAGDGLYRSTDGGLTYANISGTGGLLTGAVTDLLVDPNNPNRVYAGVVGRGVFFTDNGGTNWTATDNATLSAAGSTVVQLTAHPNGGTTAWYALVSGPTPAAFTSNDGGTNWTPLAAIPGAFASGFNNLYTGMAADQIVVEPTDATVVYIAKGYGGNHLYRYNPAGAGSWVQLESVAAVGNTSPHVDHRDLKFAGNNLITANDGGLYFLNNPINPAGNRWTSLHGRGAGGLNVTEFTNVTWDSTFNVSYGGAQDNGTSVQNGFLDLVWTSFRGADGGDAVVDTVNAGPGRVFRYSATQNFGLTRHTFDSATNQPVAAVNVVPGAGLAGYTNYFVPLYELNSADPARLVTGGGGTSPVYELMNAATATGGGDANWVAVPLGAGFTTVNQAFGNNVDAPFVYGGRLGGADNAEVLIVGSNTRVFVRSTAGGTLTATPTAFPGGTVRGIAVDPENWQRMYVTDGTGIWTTPDAGNTWNDISRNIASMNGNIMSLAFVPTAAGGVLLAGGDLGVSRLPLGLVNGLWTRLGANLPNVMVSDLEYHADDDVLVAGTFGRGAWLMQNAQSAVSGTSALIIDGDDDFAGQDDEIRLILNEFNNLILDVYVNAVHMGGFVLDTIGQIMVNGLGGMDTLYMDSSWGLIDVVYGTRYDGGTGVDTLWLEQVGGDTQTSGVHSIGLTNGSGTNVIEGPSGVQSVAFESLEPVFDLVPAALFTVNATPEHNAINYTQGLADFLGRITVDNYETIEFYNKTRLDIHTLGGDDVVNLNNASQPTGLATLGVFGNEGNDTVTTLSSVHSGVSLHLAGGPGHDLLDASGALANATLLGEDGNDTLIGGAGNDSLSGGAGEDWLDGRGGTNTVSGGGGADTVAVTGTAGADTITVADGSGGAFNVTGGSFGGNNTLSSVENASINAGSGADTVFLELTGSTNGLAYSVVGGLPLTVPGDTLFLSTSAAVTYVGGPTPDSGTFHAATGNATSIDFQQIEALSVFGGASLTASGTGGDDAITIVANSTSGAADGVRDFTLAINASAGALFIDTPSLTLNTLGGDDTITVRTPAPGGADWDVDLTIDGGPPTASDRLIVETPGNVSAAYVPGSSNGGVFTVLGATNDTVLTFTDIEQLVYDGMSGDDALTVSGTAGNDAFVHTPGSANDAGAIAINSLLGITYRNLGAGGLVLADGLGGTNSLEARGTTVGDAFSVSGAGSIALNARVPLNTAGFAQVALEGLAGDDTFTLVPDVAASPFTTLMFNGGGQASATGDRAFLSGSGGDDSFGLSGQNVTAGGNLVASTGVENIDLAMNGGSDTLTYDGVLGLQEAVNLIGSTTAGNGKISIPGVASYTFGSAEVIFANGQNDENDTLKVTGTNNVDYFNIDTRVGPGAGSAGSPVLRLQSSTAPASLLLTLADYTGFATLNVEGLDGADEFDVFTGPVGGRTLFLDGGTPSGKKKLTDKLTIFYEGKRPRIIHSTATQNPDAGLVDLDYGTSRTLVQYLEMEDVVITK